MKQQNNEQKEKLERTGLIILITVSSLFVGFILGYSLQSQICYDGLEYISDTYKDIVYKLAETSLDQANQTCWQGYIDLSQCEKTLREQNITTYKTLYWNDSNSIFVNKTVKE